MLMQVAAPIRENGKVLGALALIINPTNEFSKVLSVAHRGETGETFAFDQTGLLISESRFDLQLHALGFAEVVDPDHAGEPELEVAGVRVHLADGVPDDAVRVVVQVRPGGGQRAAGSIARPQT